MTKIYQYTHRPNNTELGKGNTHETYLLIKNEVDLSDMFPPGQDVFVKDLARGTTYTLKSSLGNEFRVNQMGQIYRDYAVDEGDEICLTKIENGSQSYVTVRVYNYNRVLINVSNNGAVIGNINRLSALGSKQNGFSAIINRNGASHNMSIVFDAAKKKRADSPTTTDFYLITLDGIPLNNGTYLLDLDSKELLDYKKYSFNTITLEGESVSSQKPSTASPKPRLQCIYFGAPGSGKSHTIEGIVGGFKNENTFRVTFHPDSDYASFVGCYKPVTKSSSNLPDTGIDEQALLDVFKNSSNYPKETKARYLYEGLIHKRDIDRLGLDAANISSKLTAQGFQNCAYVGELNVMFAIHNWLESEGLLTTNSISYKFVPQAFTNAYVKAWQSEDPVYLVIEEINRGNCAQIFGDLFQLLDRKYGISEYGVKADTDLKDYLESVLGVGHAGIKNGELHLPANLYILATMNTSDQSLFPMDSAFKRRWDWVYVPIEPENPDSQFIITIAGKKFEWKDFLIQANEHVKDVSESEDKQMGNFFIKNDIGEEDFVSKVMFYLWSEVCKDEYHARSFFHYGDGNNDEFSFNQLYKTENGKTVIDTKILLGFMNYLRVPEKP